MSIGRKIIWSNYIQSVRRWLQKYKHLISEEDNAVFANAIELFVKKNKQDPETYYDVRCVMSHEEIKMLDRYNESFLWHEKKKLSVNAGGPIIMIAFSDFNDNTTVGYKVIKSGIIADCLQSQNYDVCWYIDSCGDLRCDIVEGALGCVRYLYRVVQEGITETQLKAFLSEILDGHIPAERITAVTKRLGPMITDAYGLSRRGYRAYGKG